MNIRVDFNYPINDGTEVVFRSPVDCSQVTGLKLYHIGADGNTASQEFAFADAHGNNVGDIDHLFAENVVVKVILDVTNSMAFVQNADTNAYLEKQFSDVVRYSEQDFDETKQKQARKNIGAIGNNLGGEGLTGIGMLHFGTGPSDSMDVRVYTYKNNDKHVKFIPLYGNVTLGGFAPGVDKKDVVTVEQLNNALADERPVEIYIGYDPSTGVVSSDLTYADALELLADPVEIIAYLDISNGAHKATTQTIYRDEDRYVRFDFANLGIAELDSDGVWSFISDDTVRYTAQALTDEQKAQARANIGAIGQKELDEALENIPGGGGTAVKLDSTLSVSGMAADAGAVGAVLRKDFDLSAVALTAGYIAGNDGGLYSSSTSYQASDFIDISGLDGATLSVTSYINGNCGFALYDKNKKYINGANGNTGEFTADAKKAQTVIWTIPDGACYVRFTLMGTGVISGYPMSVKINSVIDTANSIANKVVSAGKSRSIDLSNVKVVSGYIAGDDGREYPGSYLATDFIPIPDAVGSRLTLTTLLNGNTGFSFYDRNEVFVYGLNGNSEGVTPNGKKEQVVILTVPENAYYVRFTMRPTVSVTACPMSVEYADIATLGGAIAKDITADNTPTEKSFCLVNPAAKRYMDEVTYPDDDYSYSCMYSNPVVEGRNYGAPQMYRTDRPLPVYIEWVKDDRAVSVDILLSTSYNLPLGGPTSVIYHAPFGVDRFPIYNLLPNTTYFYKVTALYADGTEKVLMDERKFTTTADHLRMIYADGCDNIRDLGGWSTYDASGAKTGTVQYGRLFRGAAIDGEYYYDAHISHEGAYELIKYVGIEAELDLRGGYTRESSPIAQDLKEANDYLSVAYQSCVSVFTDAGKSATKAAFEFIVSKLQDINTKGYLNCKPVYFHCLGGADRTGTLSYLLLGLLGVSESDITKDYELTSFSIQGYRLRSASTYGFPTFVEQLKTYTGDTLQAKIEAFLLECGISTEDIATFKTKMIKSV